MSHFSNVGYEPIKKQNKRLVEVVRKPKQHSYTQNKPTWVRNNFKREIPNGKRYA